VVNRQKVDEIRTIGRATQGVRLVNLDEGDVLMDVARVVVEDEEEEALEGEGEGEVDELETFEGAEASGDADAGEESGA
jgi:DNA gyrase subunit A